MHALNEQHVKLKRQNMPNRRQTKTKIIIRKSATLLFFCLSHSLIFIDEKGKNGCKMLSSFHVVHL